MFDGASTVLLLSVVIVTNSIVSYFVLKRRLLPAIIQQAFGQPIVKGAMSVLGQKSGAVRHETAVVDNMAEQLLNSPKLAGIKMLGKQFGFDLDEMVAEQGATDTLMGLSGLLDMIPGMSLEKLLAGNLNTDEGTVIRGKNPYLP